MKKLTKNEIKMNEQINAEIDWDIAAEEYLRDTSSDPKIIAFCHAKIKDLKARKI